MTKPQIGLILKPVLLTIAMLSTPIYIIAYASPILAPMLFATSRKESVDLGWRRASLIACGLTIIETALYLLSVTNGT